MQAVIAVRPRAWWSRPVVKVGVRVWAVISLLVKLLLIAAALYHVRPAHAQSSSLLHRDLPEQDHQPLSLSNNSWYYLKEDPPSPIKVHDLISIKVNETSALKSDGSVDRRKQGKFDAQLVNWIRLDGLNMKSAPMTGGSPQANGTLDSQYQANTNLQTDASLTFSIEATVADIRPNGNLIVEAHKTIRDNEDTWNMSLTGVVRRDDILPNNVVPSEKIAELSIDKKEAGHVRDGYRRGWLTRFYDRFSIF